MNREIPIFFSTDDHYIPYLDVAIHSLIENASKGFEYRIIVLNTGIEPDNITMVKQNECPGFAIDFVDISESIESIKSHFKNVYHFSLASYYRLFIASLFPQYDKIIYLDCDLVVLGDISELYHTDIGENVLGAVPDQYVSSTAEFRDYAQSAVGVDPDKYINTGVLVVNLETFRKNNIEAKFIELITKHDFDLLDPDQAYLNYLCQGQIHTLPNGWNKAPTGAPCQGDKHIVHYNLYKKPWQYDDVIDGNYFWNYAKKSPFYPQILRNKAAFGEQERKQKEAAAKEILEHAKLIITSDCTFVKRLGEGQSNMEKATHKLELLRRIADLEGKELWYQDVEDDPETYPLMPDQIDYLNEKLSSKIKNKIANIFGARFFDKMIEDRQLIIKEVRGIENFTAVKGGKIITCNHFSITDNYAVWVALRDHMNGKMLYKVVREGNYTNPPKPFGLFMRHCNTLPLSSQKTTMVKFMKAFAELLKRGETILIYPEQAMWWNYRKPRPMQDGAFSLAVRNKAPIVPIFITMEDSTVLDGDEFPVQEYTLHILPAIYPNEALSRMEAKTDMKNRNYEAWVKTYEEFYGMPLVYGEV